MRDAGKRSQHGKYNSQQTHRSQDGRWEPQVWVIVQVAKQHSDQHRQQDRVDRNHDVGLRVSNGTQVHVITEHDAEQHARFPRGDVFFLGLFLFVCFLELRTQCLVVFLLSGFVMRLRVFGKVGMLLKKLLVLPGLLGLSQLLAGVRFDFFSQILDTDHVIVGR